MEKILVVEDEEDIRRNIQDLLEINGYDVITASHGKEGFDLVLNSNPDLIICDINMPIMNGLDMIKDLQKFPQFYTIPFLFLTANSSQDYIRTGMGLGADDYITKPYKGNDLIKSVEVRFEKTRRIKELFTTKLDELKNNLSLSIPNELKEPLTAIMKFSKLLMGNLSEFDHKDMEGIIQHIHDSGARLMRLIENYSFYNNFLTGNVKKDDVISQNLISQNVVIKEVAETVMENYQNNVAFEYDLCGDVNINLSELYFKKVLFELIDNAVKFSYDGKPIKIVSITSGNSLILSILNQGRGMTKEEIISIDSFTQFNRDQHEQQGMGLGLAIVNQILKYADGKLRIESVIDDYTSIRIYLPLAR